MRIAIDHATVYHYDQPARYGVQELRVTPLSSPFQQVENWRVEAPGIETAASFRDAWGNQTLLVNQTGERQELAIRVHGVVETRRSDGVVGILPGEPAPRIYCRHSPLARPNGRIAELAAGLEGRHRDHISLYHALMQAISDRMTFDVDATDASTTAAEALGAAHGVCQDFAHVFIAVCRAMGHPARYVTGYMAGDDETPAAAHHAWAEAEVPGLGWVGFDPANMICPDARYVRLACGPDAGYAAPVRGIRRGHGEERLTVRVVAAAAAGQSQSQQQSGNGQFQQ